MLFLSCLHVGHTVYRESRDKQIECVVLQRLSKKTNWPIGYRSCSLNDAKHTYNITHHQCFAVVWAVLLLLPYLKDCRVTVCTDHNAPKSILSLKCSTGKLVFWLLWLSYFNFDFIYCTGIEHQATDALSRRRTNGTNWTPTEDKLPVLFITASILIPGKEDARVVHILFEGCTRSYNGYCFSLFMTIKSLSISSSVTTPIRSGE